MRQRVSINMEYGKYAIYPVGLILVINLFLVGKDETVNLSFKVIFLIAAIILVTLTIKLTKYLVKKHPKVEFDKQKLYVSYPNLKNKVIPLERINSLKMTSTSFNGRQQIQIDYSDPANRITSVTFFPRQAYLNLHSLGVQILTLNKEAEIQKLLKGPFLIEKYKG